MAAHWSDDDDVIFIPRRTYVTIEQAHEEDYAHLMAAERVKEVEAADEDLRWGEDDIEGELDDEEYDELLDAVLKIQMCYRRRLAARHVAKQLRRVWTVRTHVATRRRVYRHLWTGERTSHVPLLLRGGPYRQFACDEEAAVVLQNWARTVRARVEVRELIHSVYTIEYDDASGYYYYYNNNTGSMSWEKPAVLGGRDLYPGHPIKEKRQCEQEELAKRANPPIIGGVRSERAADYLLGDVSRRLVRFNVLEASGPERYRITTEDAPDDDAVWTRALTFFAFAQEVPKTLRYWTESSPRPRRDRLNNSYAKLLRDISRWEPSGECFYAFAVPMPGAALLNLHWAPSPDRYMITPHPKPKLTWQHRFNFYAYTATKYYVHKSISHQVERYRVTQEGPDDTWSYLFSFYGFDHQVPGTLTWRVQERHDEEYGVTVSKFTTSPTEHSGWCNVGMCCAFDMPVPGTAKYCLYLATKPSRYRIEPENVFPNFREWQHVADMYAFPSPTGVE
eukprot:g5894.t1